MEKVKDEFSEDMTAALRALFVEIGGKELAQSLEIYSAEHARRSRTLGELDEQISAAKAKLGGVEQDIVGKKSALAEASKNLHAEEAKRTALEQQCRELEAQA